MCVCRALWRNLWWNMMCFCFCLLCSKNALHISFLFLNVLRWIIVLFLFAEEMSVPFQFIDWKKTKHILLSFLFFNRRKKNHFSIEIETEIEKCILITKKKRRETFYFFKDAREFWNIFFFETRAEQILWPRTWFVWSTKSIHTWLIYTHIYTYIYTHKTTEYAFNFFFNCKSNLECMD